MSQNTMYSFINDTLYVPHLIILPRRVLDKVTGTSSDTITYESAVKQKACPNLATYSNKQARAANDKNVIAHATWMPSGNNSRSIIRAGTAIEDGLRVQGGESIALLQYQIVDHTDNIYLHDLDCLFQMQSQGKIAQICLIDEDAAHLKLLLDTGFSVTANQTSCSVIDRRVERGYLGEICTTHNVTVLAHGILLGGLLSEHWLDQPEPLTDQCDSLYPYMLLIKTTGGWKSFQRVLTALNIVAKRHKVSVPAVAIRYVLDIPVVGAVVLDPEAAINPLTSLHWDPDAVSFTLSNLDKMQISRAQIDLEEISDDEYRQIWLTKANCSSSDTSTAKPVQLPAEVAAAKGFRVEATSDSKWEPICGYCRAIRTGNIIRVSGTTATSPLSSSVALGGNSASSQMVAIFDIIEQSLKRLGSSLADVVRTRIMIRHKKYCDEVSLAHGAVFKRVGILPANTLIVAGLIEEDFLVEIEAEAEIGSSSLGVVKV